MTRLVLDETQVEVLRHSTTGVDVFDRDGRLLGRLLPAMGEAELADIRLRQSTAAARWYTIDEIHARLSALEQPT
jgi:hypothetical protein